MSFNSSTVTIYFTFYANEIIKFCYINLIPWLFIKYVSVYSQVLYMQEKNKLERNSTSQFGYFN